MRKAKNKNKATGRGNKSKREGGNSKDRWRKEDRTREEINSVTRTRVPYGGFHILSIKYVQSHRGS